MENREIRKRLLEKAIPSDYMREFYRSVHRNFTDYELAAMLWNSRMDLPERLRAIKELSESTADSRLRQQIENRLRYEETAYKSLASNEEGRYVYVAAYEDEDWPCGFFKALDRAAAYAKKDGKRKFSIKKQIIVEDELPMQKVGGWNPNLFPELQGELQEYHAYPEGEAYYSADGEILDWWSDSLPDEIENLVDNWSSEYFENHPLILENPFDRGDIVMDGDEIGVIDIAKEEMDIYNEKIKNRLITKEYYDYSDSVSTIVQYIRKDGRICHNHPSLLFLKKVKKEELPPEIQGYADIVSCMVQGNYSLDFFLSEYEKRIS